MVSPNPETAGLTVNVTPVLAAEALEAIAKQIEQRVAEAVTNGLLAGVAGLVTSVSVEPTASGTD